MGRESGESATGTVEVEKMSGRHDETSNSIRAGLDPGDLEHALTFLYRAVAFSLTSTEK
jgi:hypothetical protein